MSVERPLTYRPYTWYKISTRLFAMPDDKLHELAERAGVAIVADRDEQIVLLLKRGGFLLIEFGLTTDPSATVGTYFMDDIHEYVIDADAATQLARKEDVIVRYPGGDFAAIYTYDKLISILKASELFDQIELR